jgi:ATP-dependent Lon protease
LKGYSDEEKFWIARNYLLPKMLSNLQQEFSNSIYLSDELIYQFILEDKFESGVRKLKEKIETEVINQLSKSLTL